MDTSETYIKMNEKAEEIQALREGKEWDYVYCRGSAEAIKKSPYRDESPVVILSGYETDGGYYGHEAFPSPECSAPVSNGAYRHADRVFWDEHFWLPRQDQLQGMVGNHTWYGLILKLNQFVEEVDFSQEANEFRSMEQLWLAFVMKEKYNKVWNGDDWIKVS